MRLTNVVLVDRGLEWCIRLHFGISAIEIWIYKDMSPRQILQVFLGVVKKLVDNYPLESLKEIEDE